MTHPPTLSSGTNFATKNNNFCRKLVAEQCLYIKISLSWSINQVHENVPEGNPVGITILFYHDHKAIINNI